MIDSLPHDKIGIPRIYSEDFISPPSIEKEIMNRLATIEEKLDRLLTPVKRKIVVPTDDEIERYS